MKHILFIAFTLPLFLTGHLFAQTPSNEQRHQFQEQLKKLQRILNEYEESWNNDEARHGVSYFVNGQQQWSDAADLEVHLKAVEWILRHNEFSKRATAAQTETVLQDAAGLIEQLTLSSTRSYKQGSQICGYRSEVDHSIQPYALSLPKGFDATQPRSRRMPLYVVLHGRGGRNEVAFINQHRNKEPGADQQWIQIDVFGRIDNAYRWAGETDVFEAIDDVSRRFAIDKSRISLWGFSMGGAGAWHLGMHHPTRWASAGAGAGFVDFHIYQNKPDQLPEYQELPLRIYDTINYGLNLANIPFVTYGGDMDKQLKSSLLMQEQAQKHEVPLKLIVGKNIGHKFTPEAQAEFQEFLFKHNQQGLPRYPGSKSIRFVTFTPKYNRCHWLTIEELEQMYQESRVESDYETETGVLKLRTKNIRLLSISRDVAEFIALDGEPPLPLRNAAQELLPSVHYEKRDSGWGVVSYDDSRDYQENGSGRKRHNLQGPIDDAFMSSFVCVRGTGTPLSTPHQEWVDWTLQRFEQEFDQWMRGKIRILEDRNLSEHDIAQSHLILFGDPQSNEIIARVIQDLPIEWTKNQITVNGQSFSTDEYGLAMIYPNPLNPHKYIVINSGMTTHEQDFKASNSWLFPKLGDIAVLKFVSKDGKFEESIEWADLFNNDWDLD